jgi:hypothetical protein
MTATQKEQFGKFGCVSRCIIQLTEWHQKPITADDFIARFHSRYPQWQEFCGMLSLSDIVDICRELKIGRHANTYRDSEVVRDFFKGVKTSGVFMFTERGFDGGSKPLYHCSLVRYMNPFWLVWSPITHGESTEWNVKNNCFDEMVDKSLAHFLVLRCDR